MQRLWSFNTFAIFILALSMGLGGCRKARSPQDENTGPTSFNGQETDTALVSPDAMDSSMDTDTAGVTDAPPIASDTNADLIPNGRSDSTIPDSTGSDDETNIEVETDTSDTAETVREGTDVPVVDAGDLAACRPLEREDSDNGQPVAMSSDSNIPAGTIGSNCEHEADDYVFTSLEQCEAGAFTCPNDLSAFIDACGCGCTKPPMRESRESSSPWIPCRAPLVPSECSGKVGQLAYFETPLLDIAIAEESVYVSQDIGSERIGNSWTDITAIWRVDKETGSVTPVLDSDELALAETAVDGVVAPEQPEGYVVGDYLYTSDQGWLVRISTTDQTSTRIFEIPSYDYTYLVIDDELYSTSEEGALWYANLGEVPSEPIIVEQRGEYDEDDYRIILGADENAVYWVAGANPSYWRTTDGDPMALFRTCRIK